LDDHFVILIMHDIAAER